MVPSKEVLRSLFTRQKHYSAPFVCQVKVFVKDAEYGARLAALRSATLNGLGLPALGLRFKSLVMGVAGFISISLSITMSEVLFLFARAKNH